MAIRLPKRPTFLRGCFPAFDRVIKGNASTSDAEMFRAQMLTEMARMSIDDGLVMQIHPGSFRNHNPTVFERFGLDKGADIPDRLDLSIN